MMFAQVIEAAWSPVDRAEVVRIVREDLIPALRNEEGFSGAVGMVEAGTGRAMMIAFWERKAQAVIPPAQRGPAFRAALADLEARSAQPRSISTWEVGIEL
jgi:quinol monooxygenase YgiN